MGHKMHRIIYVFLLLIMGCTTSTHHEASKSKATVVNEFVDAFYSFNNDSLESILALAEESQPGILYYQKWAECGNYKVVKRGDLIEKNDSLILVPVTVKDDLMAALQIDFNVTDTFHIAVQKGKIRSVQTSSNDPKEYYEAKEWVKQNRSELIERPCEGIWEGGPTPCECILGMIKGFKAFVAEAK
jgi:hypothetical protein